MGAPCKLTTALADRLVEGVRRGLFDAQNALQNGIDVNTLKSWVDRGIDEDAAEPFKSFAERYIREMIALEDRVINIILDASADYDRQLDAVEDWHKAGGEDDDDLDIDGGDYLPPRFISRKKKRQTVREKGDWRAAAWFAERRWPLRWGNRAPEGGPRDALRLPDAPTARRQKVLQMTNAPPPELVKAFRDAGWDLVKREIKT